MQQMGSRMVKNRLKAFIGVDARRDFVAYGKSSRTQASAVAMEFGRQLLGILHIKTQGITGTQLAGIADLAAGFGIERGFIKNDHALLACYKTLYRLLVFQQRDYPAAVAFCLLIALEFGSMQAGH